MKMSQYFPKPFNSHFGDSIKVKIDLSNYATKTDIKNISHVGTSSFALKTNLANLKTEVDKLDIDKLVPIPVDLSKLGWCIEIENKLNNFSHDKYIDTSEFNELAADVFNARLAHANLIIKNCRILTEKLLKINQNIHLLKMNWIS